VQLKHDAWLGMSDVGLSLAAAFHVAVNLHLQERQAAVEELMDKFAKQALDAAAKVWCAGVCPYLPTYLAVRWSPCLMCA
jgi:hypothetical protein